MSDGGSPGPMSSGQMGGNNGGGTSPNPEAMIASSSSVKSKFKNKLILNHFWKSHFSKIEKKWSKELYLYESVHLARADADETGNRTQTKPNKVELT